MRKKKYPHKSSLDSKKEQFKIYKARFRNACSVFAVEDLYHTIPEKYLLYLFGRRLPLFKLVFEKGLIPSTHEFLLQEYFKRLLRESSVTLGSGVTISLLEYFRDGIPLYAYAMEASGLGDRSRFAHILEAFNPQFPTLRDAEYKLVDFINRICLINSELGKINFVFDMSSTMIMGPEDCDNKIRISGSKPITQWIKFHGEHRKVIHLSWSDVCGKVTLLNVCPARLGFRTESIDEIPVYVQPHAISRLKERLSLHAGLLGYFLYHAFSIIDPQFKLQNRNLLPFYIKDKKLGYLVVEIEASQLLIVTFLFITNDGTPEGRKLAELTSLQKLDKQYIGIDTLSGFKSLSIQPDSDLGRLFTEAGCAHLLDLSDINALFDHDIHARDPELLLKYLGLGGFSNINQVRGEG
ncbi:hypothetical protein [Pedobacter frigidisoli]|uniref:hypothetical protein n=1 Tax=Pedobacter frigidisoli TaxID=2530455 RepID=UPI00292FEF5C|nr:hypothetical protein [Pedobacter frigidisoli]